MWNRQRNLSERGIVKTCFVTFRHSSGIHTRNDATPDDQTVVDLPTRFMGHAKREP
jgi:hypothetical protein